MSPDHLRHSRLKRPDHRAVIRVHLSSGEIRTMLGQGELALAAYRRGAIIASAFGDIQSRAESLLGISLVHFYLNQYEQLIQSAEQALEFYRTINDKKGVADCHNNLCFANYSRGDNHAAEVHYQEAIRLHTEIGNRAGLAESYNNAGLVQARDGHFARSMEYFTSCHTIFSALGDRHKVGLMLNNLGMMHAQLGDYDTAIDHLQRALALQAAIGDTVSRALSHYNQGALRCQQDRHEEALEHLQQALILYRKIGDSTSEAWVLAYIGASHLGEGCRQQAYRYLTAAKQAAVSARDDDILSRIELLLGDYEVCGPEPAAATGHIHALLELAERYQSRGMRAAALVVRARLSVIMGNAAAAESDFVEAVGILRDRRRLCELATTSFHYARFLVQGNHSSVARAHLSTAREIFTMIGNARYVRCIADLEQQIANHE